MIEITNANFTCTNCKKSWTMTNVNTTNVYCPYCGENNEGPKNNLDKYFEQYWKYIKELPPWYKDNTGGSNIPFSCRNCSNHPSNGGSGTCHCTLGQPTIT